MSPVHDVATFLLLLPVLAVQRRQWYSARKKKLAWRGQLGHRDDVIWSLKVRLLLPRGVAEPVPDEDLEVSAPSSLSESTRGHGGPGFAGS